MLRPSLRTTCEALRIIGILAFAVSLAFPRGSTGLHISALVLGVALFVEWRVSRKLGDSADFLGAFGGIIGLVVAAVAVLHLAR